MQLRLATPDDVRPVADIYNYDIRHADNTFDTEEVSYEWMLAWLARHESPYHPVIVCEMEKQVRGWAALSSWSERCGYRRAAEVSIYVHHEYRRRGVGKALLGDLIKRAKLAPLGVLLARVNASSEASLKLHESFGFERIGTMRRVGEKFGRVLDVVLFDLQLDSTPRRDGQDR